MMPALEILFLLVCYALACTAIGAALTRLLARRPATGPETFTDMASAFLLGVGCLANLWTLLAVVGWFTTPFVAGTLLVGTMLGMSFAPPQWSKLAERGRALWGSLRQESAGWQIIAVLVLLTALAGSLALGREMSGDPLALHMLVPKAVAGSHTLEKTLFAEANVFYGLQGEMTYAAFLSLGSEAAARMSSWLMLLAGSVVFAGLCARVGLQQRGQLIALSCLFSSTAVLYWIGEGKIDLFHTAYGLAAYYWAVPVKTDDERLRFRLAGLFTGLAIVTKIQYAQTLAPGVALLLVWPHLLSFWQQLRSGSWSVRMAWLGGLLGPLLVLGLWSSLAVAPHLIKNAVVAGNPLAPFTMDGRHFQWLNDSWYSDKIKTRIMLTLPFALTFGGYWAQYGNLSPLVLAFFPLAFFLPRPRAWASSPLTAITVVAALILIHWVIGHPDKLVVRYFLASLLLWIPLAARAAEHASLWKATVVVPRAIIGCTIAVLLLVFCRCEKFVYCPGNAYRYLKGGIEAVADHWVWCAPWLPINREAPPDARVFSTSSFKYYLRPDLLRRSSGIGEPLPLQGATPEERWQFCFRQGYGYLVVDEADECFARETFRAFHDDLAAAPSWVHVAVLYQKGPITVYRIGYHQPPMSPLLPSAD